MSDQTPSPPVPSPEKPILTLLKPLPWWLVVALSLVVGGIGFAVWWFFLPLGPDLVVPDKATGDPGSFISVSAQSHGNVTWYTPDTGLAVFPSGMLRDSKTAVVIAKAPGTYRLIAFAAHHGHIHGPAVCLVVVGNVPPGPGPGPSDPFFQTLQAAYSQETNSTKQADVQQLAALYDQAAKVTLNDVSLSTVGDFASKFEGAVNLLLPKTSIPKVRAAIGTNLNSVLPRPVTVPLDANAKSVISSNFLRIAADLEALK